MRTESRIPHETDPEKIVTVAGRQWIFFEKGHTRSYAFRLRQLKALKELIVNNEDRILEALQKDLGKPQAEAYASEIGFAKAELNRAIRRLKKWMQPRKVRTGLLNYPARSYILPEPKGVSLIIAPWNYPFNLVIVPLISNIAAGNTALLKPAENAAYTSELLVELISKTFEDEYVYVIYGDGAKLLPPLMEAFRFDHVFFTGSARVGKIVAEMAARKLTPVTLELGGKSPAIIDESANLRIAARRLGFGKFLNAGQTCIAPDYILIHHAVYDKFLQEFKKVLEDFYGGNALGSDSYSSIISDAHFRKMLDLMAEADILYGGDYDQERLRIAPTLLGNVDLDSSLMSEEIFGPLLPLIPYRDDEEALRIIARNPNPLAFYVFSSNRRIGDYFMEKVAFGGGMVNHAVVHFVSSDLPFGGVGNSGYGSYHGQAGFEVFSHHKSIMRSATWIDPSFKYPPYGNFFMRVLRRLMG